jgi:hypothetical protein
MGEKQETTQMFEKRAKTWNIFPRAQSISA